jgi:hypothetical protein
MKNIKMSVMVLVMGMFVMSCTVGNIPNNTPTDVSTETQIPATITPTAIPQLTSTPGPTFTPSPTYTATPLPEWIANFTEPILKAIADRSPTYEDDFSNPYSGWYNGQTTGHPNVLISGEKKYDNGEYYVVANGATAAEPTVCSGVEDRNVGRYTDFVVEFDVRFVSGTDGDWQLQFLRSSEGGFKIQLGRTGRIHFRKYDFGLDGSLDFEDSFGNSVHGGDEWNHIQLIVQGTKMAAYVNGVPSLYAEDKQALVGSERGYFSINSCNPGSSPLETRWDNFRLWDISNLP